LRTAAARDRVPLDPARALRLWTDPGRWASFVEGFGQVLSRGETWPEPGAKLVWRSTPGGRGTVTERVVELGEGRFATQVYEEALAGRQSFAATPAPDGGSDVELSLEYELSRPGPLRALSDALFIRRALRDALRRTLRRFAVEADEEAGLR
jgi:hypothetical protein